MPGLDVVLLAGGRSTRMGSDKAPLPVAGRRLIDHVLDELAGWAGRGRVVVVAPQTLAVPGWVLQTMESPPAGGPVAGLFAGLEALEAADDSHILLLSCDAPRAARLAEPLAEAAERHHNADGVLASAGGRRQYLLAVYRVAGLRRGLRAIRPDGDPHGTSMRNLVAELVTVELPVSAELAADLDDPAQLRRWLADHRQ